MVINSHTGTGRLPLSLRRISMEDFIALMMKNLEKNGFPAKKVSFDIVKLYELADQRGLSFNKVLDELKTRGIDHKKKGEKYIFSPRKIAQPDLSGLSPDFLAKAQELVQNSDEDQFAVLQTMVQDQLKSMSDAERAQLFEQIKGMGLS